ncbi:MAG: VIT1/CCC1 transporter family protein [Candidatus Aenigmarchaeota archaeon]|nr:VIT1/CCC1 transporter family protein [Candidatus Aenigmarchaeota archaeon]
MASESAESPYKHLHVEYKTEKAKIVKNIVFGIQDGSLTSLGVVTGVTGALADNFIIILAGFVALITEAISMGAGEYISSKSEIEVYRHETELEKKEMAEVPEIEKQEIADIYRAKGFRGKLLNQIVKKITSDKHLWLDTMLREELGFPEKFESPAKLGAIMFVTSLIGGIIPILPYLFMRAPAALPLSVIITAAALFVTGASKTVVTKTNWLKSGIEMMLVGMLVAFAGYSIGSILGVRA